MILHLLVFCTNIKDNNLVEYFKAKIEASNIEIAYNELNNIISIGPKIASFLLRDIVLLYNLEDEISQEDRVYIQPIDTWIEKIAFAMMNKKLKEENISAANFNAGAWFYSRSRTKSN